MTTLEIISEGTGEFLKVDPDGYREWVRDHKAGAMGLPFIPVRSFGGTDGFEHSGAKLIADPYTGEPITIVPALNPDVALIHVHQADVYGNARIFGTGISHVESAMASKKVIISTEEVIDTEEIKRDPGRTTIPYYAVDA